MSRDVAEEAVGLQIFDAVEDKSFADFLPVLAWNRSALHFALDGVRRNSDARSRSFTFSRVSSDLGVMSVSGGVKPGFSAAS